MFSVLLDICKNSTFYLLSWDRTLQISFMFVWFRVLVEDSEKAKLLSWLFLFWIRILKMQMHCLVDFYSLKEFYTGKFLSWLFLFQIRESRYPFPLVFCPRIDLQKSFLSCNKFHYSIFWVLLFLVMVDNSKMADSLSCWFMSRYYFANFATKKTATRLDPWEIWWNRYWGSSTSPI